MVSQLKKPANSLTGGRFSCAQPVWQIVALNVLTSGLYFPYWFFRNWRDLKNQLGMELNPWLRSLALVVPVLNLVMIYSQFQAIRKTARQKVEQCYSSPMMLTLGFLSFNLMMAFARLEKMQGSINGLWLANASILFYLLLTTWILAVVQETLNNLWLTVQPDLPKKTGFSKVELAVLVIGLAASAVTFYPGAF